MTSEILAALLDVPNVFPGSKNHSGPAMKILSQVHALELWTQGNCGNRANKYLWDISCL